MTHYPYSPAHQPIGECDNCREMAVCVEMPSGLLLCTAACYWQHVDGCADEPDYDEVDNAAI